MADVKTVTPREIKQITNAICEKPKTILWHGKRININPLLSFKETFELVSDVINGCTKSEDNVIIAEVVDFVFKSKTLEKYGNIELPDDIESQYQIIYGSDIVKNVWGSVNKEQLDMLKRTINYYTGVYLYE
jgi:hypothetical protein